MNGTISKKAIEVFFRLGRNQIGRGQSCASNSTCTKLFGGVFAEKIWTLNGGPVPVSFQAAQILKCLKQLRSRRLNLRYNSENSSKRMWQGSLKLLYLFGGDQTMQMMQMHDKSDRVPLKSALALPCPSAIRYCRFFSSLHCCCRWTAPFFSWQGTQSFTTDIMDRTLGSAKKPCKTWKIITTILLRDLDSPSLSISIHYYRVVPKLYRLCSTKLYGQKYETNSSEHYEHRMQHSMPCSIYVHHAVLSFQSHSQCNIK